jgi:leucyl aminopeptidase
MRATSTTDAPASTPADTIALGVFEDEGIAHDLPGAELSALLDAGEAKRSFKHLAVWHQDDRRWLVVGLGARDAFTAERARIAAAVVHGRAKELDTKVLCWEVPHHVGEDVVGGLVEGTLLAAYRFDRFKSSNGGNAGVGVEELVLSAHHDVASPVARAVVVAEAVNAARDLQNAPANVLTPTALGERALALEGVHAEVEGPEQIEARGMGSFMAVARGSDEEPRLITLAYEPPEFVGPHLVFVGKAVTFDSGGISIKPGAKMADMKFDMSGGAAVIEAIGAIARLGLPVRVTGVVGATENMPSGRSMRPSDVVTAMNGTTIEIINTDCEGRMVLADCLAHAVNLGAERIIDLATLTGAMANFFGSTYAGLLGDDDGWVQEVRDAGERTGELVWRLPLHDEYAELIKGSTGDIVNLNEPRGAGGITAAQFLQHFTGGVPWAHIDMAGTADNTGKPYAPKGGAGWGVRLLVDLATQVAADSGSK